MNPTEFYSEKILCVQDFTLPHKGYVSYELTEVSELGFDVLERLDTKFLLFHLLFELLTS